MEWPPYSETRDNFLVEHRLPHLPWALMGLLANNKN